MITLSHPTTNNNVREVELALLEAFRACTTLFDGMLLKVVDFGAESAGPVVFGMPQAYGHSSRN